jgi:hypothetical protein
MEPPIVQGLIPWQPWPLSRWRWWSEPVAAERLVALRIGMAGVHLLDILLTYLPGMSDFFGRNSLGQPGLFRHWLEFPAWRWSLLEGIEATWILQAAGWIWALATLGLLLGFWTRTNAALAWVMSTSFANLNPSIDNGGDIIRWIVLFYLALSPCGATWSLDALWRNKDGRGRPVLIHPWPLRLLFVQMIFIYMCNGLFKVGGDEWREGTSLYYVLCDLTLARWSYEHLPTPFWITQTLSWLVLAWEIGFPLWVILPWTRKLALWLGVAFHVGIGLSLELGFFAPYMLCLYLPLLPWERWRRRRV